MCTVPCPQIPILAVVIGMILTFSVLTFQVAKGLGYSRKDVVCIMFCSTHKSLTLGMPMLKIVFADHPMLSLLSLPLLLYHPTQIFLGGLMVPMMTDWVKMRPGRDSSEQASNLPTSSPTIFPPGVWEADRERSASPPERVASPTEVKIAAD